MRKLFTFSLACSAAVFAAHYGLTPLLLALPLLALVKREDRQLRCALLCAGLALGLLWPRTYDGIFRAPARALEGQTASITATVTDFPWATVSGGGVTVRVRPASGPSFLARLYGEADVLDLLPGDGLAVTADCRSAGTLRGADTDLYTSQGVYLIAYARSELQITRPDRPPASVWPAYAARALKDRIAALFPNHTAPLMTALLTGDKSALSDPDYAALRRAGLAHAVAVSGMHLAFLVSLSVLLFGRHRRRTAAIAIPLVWCYALVVGAPPSALRAAVMQTLLLIAPLAGRENDPPTSLSFALLLLLVQNPCAAGSVGLQLSFASVAGILAVSVRFFRWAWDRVPDPWPRPAKGLARFVLSSLAASLGALVFTTPLSAYYFGMVSLVAPLSGLLCLWAVSLVFPLGLLAAATGLAPLALACGPLLGYLLRTAHGLARLPFAAVTTAAGYLVAAVAFGYLLLVLFLLWKGPRRPFVPLSAALIYLCAALVLTRLDYTLGPLTLTALSVGQGQAVLIRAGDRVMLVDCGGNGPNAGDAAADYLADRGLAKLDLLVLTHFHADHANGVPELLARTPVDVLAAPAPEPGDPLAAEILSLAREAGTEIVTVTDDRVTSFGEAQLTLYAPLGAGEANESGLSVLCRTGTFSALLTGDMDQTIEKRLVKYGALPDVDLLIAGHHGAKTSTSQTLLEAVKPETVVVSAGYNTYGHPAPETLDRIAATGAGLYRTDLQGNITVTLR